MFPSLSIRDWKSFATQGSACINLAFSSNSLFTWARNTGLFTEARKLSRWCAADAALSSIHPKNKASGGAILVFMLEIGLSCRNLSPCVPVVYRYVFELRQFVKFAVRFCVFAVWCHSRDDVASPTTCHRKLCWTWNLLMALQPIFGLVG